MTAILIISAVLNAIALAVYIVRKVRRRREERRIAKAQQREFQRQVRAEDRATQHLEVLLRLRVEGLITEERAEEEAQKIWAQYPNVGLPSLIL